MAYLRTRLGRWFYEDLPKEGSPPIAGEPTIVLLHSLLCDGSMWRGQLAPLRALGRVVVFDGPGHGKSESPPPFTLEDHARTLVEAWDELKISRAIIVGLSWGGMLGMRVALQRPERLAAMVLLDTSADGTKLRERIEYRAMCAIVRSIGYPPRLLRTKIVPLMFTEHTRQRSPELVDEFVRTLSGFPRQGLTLAATAVSIDRPPIVENLRAVTVPTLIGCGDEDVATPPDHSRRIASHIAGSRLVMFPGAAHLSALEAPALVNDAVVPFVREHLSPR